MKNLFQLYDQLCVSKKFLTHLASNIDSHYYKKIRPKIKFGKMQEGPNKTIKLRHLIPPKRKLKLIQKKIRFQLQKITLPNCMYGAIKHRNNVDNALVHIENKFFLSIDLKDFFKRINHFQIYYTYVENGYCAEVARILTKLSTYNYSLPQGAPTSPVLANLAFKKTTLELLELIKDRNITFTTFLDDLTFSSKDDFLVLKQQILKIIKKNKFFPHPEKVCYCTDKCDVTGIFVGNGTLEIHPQMLHEAKINCKVSNYVMYVQKRYQNYMLSKKQ